MKPNKTMLALSTMSMTSALPTAQDETEAVNIAYHVNKATSSLSLEALSLDGSTVLGYSCSSTLNSGIFDKNAISLDVDNNGAGTIHVGNQSFNTHGAAGDAACGRVVNADGLIVSCQITVPKLDQPSQVAVLSAMACHEGQGGELYKTFLGFSRKATMPQDMAAFSTVSTQVPRNEDGTLDGCGYTQRGVAQIGDGNPHQNPLNIQLSEPLQCDPEHSCRVGHSESNSYTVGWHASAEAFGWISAGFAVEQSIETGNDYDCDGSPGDYLAVWKNQAQTAYTVQNTEYNVCTGTRYVDNPYVIWSPNNDNRGGYYYCVYGRDYVRNKGDQWLDTSPNHPGGP